MSSDRHLEICLEKILRSVLFRNFSHPSNE
jgi:hypothetical protein